MARNGQRQRRLAPGDLLAAGASVSTPFVFVARRRVVVEASAIKISVPINFDVIDVAVRKANHVFGIVDSLDSSRQFFRLVPGPWLGSSLFRNDISFDRLYYRAEFQSSNAGSWFGGGVGSIEYVAGVNRFVKLIRTLGTVFRDVSGSVTKRVRRAVEYLVQRRWFAVETDITFHEVFVKKEGVIRSVIARRVGHTGQGVPVVIRIQMHAQVDLFQIAQTDGPLRCCFRAAQGRQQQRGQKGDDGNDHQQLNQSESAIFLAILFHRSSDSL